MKKHTIIFVAILAALFMRSSASLVPNSYILCLPFKLGFFDMKDEQASFNSIQNLKVNDPTNTSCV